VFAADEPNIGDTERRERAPRFNLPSVSEGSGLLGANLIFAATPVGTICDCYPLSLIDAASEVRSCGSFVVRMSDYQQNIGFVARVRLSQRFGLLREREIRHRDECQDKYELPPHE